MQTYSRRGVVLVRIGALDIWREGEKKHMNVKLEPLASCATPRNGFSVEPMNG